MFSEIKKYIPICILIILLTFSVGFIKAYFHPVMVEENIAYQETVAQQSGSIDENGNINIFFIFLNNFICTILIIVIGIIPKIPISLLAMGINGYMIGNACGYTLNFVELGVLLQYCPHIILEFSVMVISASLGIWFSKQPRNRKNKQDNSYIIYNFKKILPMFKIVIPLLLIASVLEGINL